MKKEDLQEFNITKDMLKGCIARICVSDDTREIDNMYEYAKKYLKKIYTIRKIELISK